MACPKCRSDNAVPYEGGRLRCTSVHVTAAIPPGVPQNPYPGPIHFTEACGTVYTHEVSRLIDQEIAREHDEFERAQKEAARAAEEALGLQERIRAQIKQALRTRAGLTPGQATDAATLVRALNIAVPDLAAPFTLILPAIPRRGLRAKIPGRYHHGTGWVFETRWVVGDKLVVLQDLSLFTHTSSWTPYPGAWRSCEYRPSGGQLRCEYRPPGPVAAKDIDEIIATILRIRASVAPDLVRQDGMSLPEQIDRMMRSFAHQKALLGLS